MSKRRKYSDHYKQQAVRLVLKDDYYHPVQSVSRDLGINASTLRRWVDKTTTTERNRLLELDNVICLEIENDLQNNRNKRSRNMFEWMSDHCKGKV